MLRLGILLSIVLPASMLFLSCAPRESRTSASQARSPNDATVPITVAPVRLLKVDRTIPVVGTLFPKDEATLAAEVEGRVDVTMAEFGDRLTNGQVIAQIDTTTYEALAQQAAANLSRAKATAL